MKEKRSHDELVIARKQRGTSQLSHTVQSDDGDTLDTATLATDADVQVTFAITYSPCGLHQPRFLQCHLFSMMHGNGNIEKKRGIRCLFGIIIICQMWGMLLFLNKASGKCALGYYKWLVNLLFP